ncbi:MAG: GIY-YIG nuclease family protein [Gemmatimonadales bacterium]|nr:GIY-YIG nuclease family protein [Gemmatimonadales bacterium]
MSPAHVVYIAVSPDRAALYCGVTDDLAARAAEHRAGRGPPFAARHGCTRIVWVEAQPSAEVAAARAARLREASRSRKVRLVEQANPAWADLLAPARCRG